MIDAVQIPDGGLVVADRRRNQILFYDSLGSYLTSAGGPGEGPGEFRDIGALEVVGDSLLAFDWRLGRLTVLDFDGQFLGTVQLEKTSDDGHPIHTYNLAGVLGSQLVMAPWAIMPLGQISVGPYWDSGAILLYSLDGTLQDELGEPYRTEMYVGTQGSSGRPFGARTTIASDGVQLFMGTGKTFEVRVFDTGGELARVIRRAWTPRRVNSPVVDSLIDFRIRQIGATSRTDPRAAAMRQMLESAPMPEHMPAFSGLMVDHEGHLWAHSYSASWEDGPQTWSIFDQNGSWLGDFRTPERFSILGFGDHVVLGVWRDSLNVQHFQVYGLDWQVL
ncbi:MAG: 6-bladed beta-propeller [Longimicrobiales bacterium]|nr:6-bladed beta-propeller [Longimicrobiales bacterium]